MTAKRAWKKVVEDYERRKAIRGERYAYEEMKRACYEMESGVTEPESYENFGRRCDVQVYVRFGEEAGTKLLLPMFLMLAIVLVIVIVPAFLSVQI